MFSHNPSLIKPHIGKTYVTLNPDVIDAEEHRYSIDYEGRFHGRPSLEGLKVESVAGMEPDLHEKALDEIHKNGFRQWDFFIRENGKNPPMKGLCLVASLISNNSKQSRLGIFSSPIQKIFPYPSEVRYFPHKFEDGTTGIRAENMNWQVLINERAQYKVIKKKDNED